jgi:hypothetical protein
MRYLIVAGFTAIFLLIAPAIAPSHAQRFATCDQCGYCKDVNPTPPAENPPGNWESCRQCLYPEASQDALSNSTLLIDPSTNAAPAPKAGHFYTQIGCLSTNLEDFTQAGSAGSVVQQLLNVAFSIAGGIAFLYFIYGSFMIITSQADPEKLNHGRRLIVGSVIGIALVLGSVFLVNFIGSTILRLPGFGAATP